MLKGLKTWKEHVRKLLFIMQGRHKVLVTVLLMVVIVNAALQTLSVYAIAPLVSSMTNREMFMSSSMIVLLSELFHTDDYTNLFCLLCAIISLLYFLKELVGIFQIWFSIKIAQKIQREISRTVLNSYMYRQYDFFLNYGTAKVVRDVKEDPTSVYNMITCFVNLFTEMFTITMLMIYVVVSDYQMAVCMALLAALCIFLMIYGFKRPLFRVGTEARIVSAENQKVLLEAVEGIKEVQVMKKQRFFVDSFYDSYIKAQKPLIFQGVAVSAPTYAVEGIFVIGIIGFLAFKAVYDVAFWKELPFLASFLVAAIRMLPSIGRITNNVNNIQFSVPALDSVYANVISIRNEKLKKDSDIMRDNGNTIVFEKELKLENVSYRYEDSEKNVLNNLDLTVEKGKSIGIVGQSGAGKSTLADIILGLHVPQNGSVKIDGKNIFDIPYEYSRVIGYVPQNVYLVDGTVKENVAFGVDEKDFDEQRIVNVLKQAKLYDFVLKLDNGLETIVGERGVKFSGGQRQRLAIARALYRKPQILILDEATSALDNETEAAVMEQVEEMQGTITLIIVAHRLSTIEKCDSVYEIQNGKAVKKK